MKNASRLGWSALVFAILLLSATVGTIQGQQGHPLDGTWYGDWGPSDTHRNAVVLVLDYDGDQLSGLINPGPDAIPLEAVELDESDWTVHLEATATNRAGEPIEYSIDGQIENLGLPNRSLRGTWQHGDETGTFLVTRN